MTDKPSKGKAEYSPELRSRLAAFLPRTFWPLIGSETPVSRLDGCVLFADVAGFTPLTEGLARIGKEGAEELTRILNDFFTAMITIIHEEGGDVLRFGGDAMTLIFPTGSEGGLKAALRMQREAARFSTIHTRGGDFPLAMKVGISKGSVLLGTVGSEKLGQDYFAAGEALDLAAEAEHHAAKGQVALCPACSKELTEQGAPLKILEDGYGVVEDPLSFPLSDFGETLIPPLPPIPEGGALSSFLPSFIEEKARVAEGLSVAEHRRTTVLFLMFKGLDYDNDPEVGEKVRTVYGEIAEIVQRYSGWINKIDMGDKGSKAIACFGTPYALERQEELGCRAAMEILENQTLRKILQDLKIGITVAPLFAAYVGSDERREYTVMGDGINLAARLMASAFSWKILNSEGIYEMAKEALTFRALDPIFVKGKKDKIQIFRPEGDRGQVAEAAERFVGRESLLESIEPRLVNREEPFTLVLTGEAGVGKTAFLKRLTREMGRRGIRYVNVPLASYSAHSYMSAWRPVLHACLGAGLGDSPEIVIEALRTVVRREDLPFLPLFQNLLGIELRETEATQVLEAKDRKDVLFTMLRRMILKQCSEEPYCVLLDQMDYADPASLEFLQVLIGEIGSQPLKIILSHRSNPAKPIQEAMAGLETVEVPTFDSGEIQDYLLKIAGYSHPSTTFLEYLTEKTRGNPKFLEQILTALESAGLVIVGHSGKPEVDEDRLAKTSFPDTLQGLLLSRVDNLSESDKYLLKVASILGTSFSLPLLAKLIDREAEEIRQALLALQEVNLVRMDSWGTRPYATFSDPLLRDALYDSLNYGTKRTLHFQVASILEEEGGKVSRLWPVLARHFDAASEDTKAHQYLWLSAEESRSRYDYKSSFDYLSRYVEIAKRAKLTMRDDPRFRRVLLYLAEANNQLGRFDEADKYSQEILDITSDACEETVRSLTRMAENQRKKGKIPDALDLYGRAMEQARKLKDRELECRVLLDSGVPLAMSGRMGDALENFQKAEVLARKIRAYPLVVYAIMNQGLARHFGGNREAGKLLLQRARRVAKRHEVRPYMAHITLNLGQMLFDIGPKEYKKALSFCLEGMEITRQFGYRNHHVLALTNAALYRTYLGRWDDALSTVDHALSTTRHYGFTYETATNLHVQGILKAIFGDFDGAVASQSESIRTHLGGRFTGEALASLNEILAVSNLLRHPDIGLSYLKKYRKALEEEIKNEDLKYTIGFTAQHLLLQFHRGDLSYKKARNGLEKTLERARPLEAFWLTCEVGEAMLRLHRLGGKPEEAVRQGMELFPLVAGDVCPPKVAPFLLLLASAFLEMEDYEGARPVLRALRRYEKTLDRGPMGIRYYYLQSQVSLRSRAFTQYRRRRSKGIRMVYEVAKDIKNTKTRAAFFALPMVIATLRGSEAS